MIKTLDGKLLKEMILGAAAILEKNKETLDSLNVFPVPDGDTGTNMSLTMISAAKEVAAVEQEDDLVKIVQAMSLGALKGARGNSGVILSQIFAGFADAIVKAQQDMTTTLMAQALRNGVEYAYKAVMKPKEGTILTVTSSVASAAEKIAEKTEDLYEQLAVYYPRRGKDPEANTRDAPCFERGGSGGCRRRRIPSCTDGL